MQGALTMQKSPAQGESPGVAFSREHRPERPKHFAIVPPLWGWSHFRKQSQGCRPGLATSAPLVLTGCTSHHFTIAPPHSGKKKRPGVIVPPEHLSQLAAQIASRLMLRTIRLRLSAAARLDTALRRQGRHQRIASYRLGCHLRRSPHRSRRHCQRGQRYYDYCARQTLRGLIRRLHQQLHRLPRQHLVDLRQRRLRARSRLRRIESRVRRQTVRLQRLRMDADARSLYACAK